MSFHMILTSRASWYAPPDTEGIRFDISCRRMTAVNRRCGGNFDGSYLLAGSSWFAGSKRLPLGEAGSAKPGLMRAGEHLRTALQFQQNRHCSPALIRPCGAPSPRGRHWVRTNTENFPRKKVQPDKFRLHLLLTASILRQLVTNLIPPYQAARSQKLVR